MIYQGPWQEALDGVECDALITDPPYGARTHNGQRTGEGNPNERGSGYYRDPIAYDHWTPSDVHGFVEAWAPRVRGWMVALTCSDLIPHWRAAYEAAGRCTFAPVPCVIIGMTCRLAGDGPSSWAVYAMVSRPRTREAARWGTLPGAYIKGQNSGAVKAQRLLVGGKPLALMLDLVRDYSREGDLVCDPCAGLGTTLVAAKITGRRYVGAEMDAERCAAANKRLDATIAGGQTPIEIAARNQSDLLADTKGTR